MIDLPSLTWSLVVGLAAAVGAAMLRRRYDVALGLLIFGASASGVTAPFGELQVRLEQPSLLIVAVVALGRLRDQLTRVIRGALPLVVGVGVYVGVQIVSSIAYAPDPPQSLKILGWLALSILGGLLAASLVVASRQGDLSLSRALVVAGIAQSLVACLQVAAELVVGSSWGVLRSDAPVGKAYGLSWEPNLFAIFLSVCLVLVLAPSARPPLPRPWLVPGSVLLAIGLGLALSRGGLLGLIVGCAVGLAPAVVAATRGLTVARTSPISLARTVSVIAIAVGTYSVIGWMGSQGVGLRPGDQLVSPDAKPQPSLIPAASEPPAAGRPSQQPSPDPGASRPPSPSPSAVPDPSPSPRYVGTGDTIALRLRNLRTAVTDALSSPLVGLGTDTFGQRYIEPTCGCKAHIPNLTAAVLYESGIVGLGSVGVAMAWLVRRAWRAGRIDLVAAVVALLVGYQFTDALRFAWNWLLLGAVIGVVVTADRVRLQERAGMPGPSSPRTAPM